MPLRLLFLLVVCSLQARAQFTDRFWALGDSAAIDFSNLSNPVSGESILRSRGTCVSICDSLGGLLFYAGSPNTNLWPMTTVNFLGYVVNKDHQLMEDGDTIVSNQNYQEMAIVPNPGNEKQFYLFSGGVTLTTNPGFYWSLVDLTYNGGLGRVVQKNVQLQNFPVNDGLAAVKHGNGRDWWVIHEQYVPGGYSDEVYVYLVDPSGISQMPVQHIGRLSQTNTLRLKFSPSGSKLISTDSNQYLELFDFDRCTGLLSNPRFVHQRQVTTLNGLFWSSEFSPDETKLYLSTVEYGNNDSISCLIQFDLLAPDIQASMDTIYNFICLMKREC